LQFAIAVALGLILFGFTALALGLASTKFGNLIPLIGIGFLGMFLSLPFLANSKCPECRQLFCGPQDENTSEPGTNVFTSSCKYCGFSIKSKPPMQ
jgi:hypothetical protein